MAEKKQYNGLDVVKFFMALLVAQRHVVQIFFGVDSKWRIIIGNWLSNLAVPVFFIIAGFFLFRKVNSERSDERVVYRYCWRVLRLYLIWTALYLPLDWYNWYHGDRDIAKGVLSWLHSFFFCSSTVQLWYLPALCVACFLVWQAYRRGMRQWQILLIGALFLAVGIIGDNWYFNQRLPQWAQEVLRVYWRYFITFRNGVFYGFFYVALGLHFAKRERQIPFGAAAAGFVIAFVGMFAEVWHFTNAGSNTNFVICAAPAAYFLFAAASAVTWQDRKLYPRLRGMSEWIYLSHFYFFYFINWLRPWNPIPYTSKTVTVMIMVPLVAFAWAMVRLSETGRGYWLRRLI